MPNANRKELRLSGFKVANGAVLLLAAALGMVGAGQTAAQDEAAALDQAIERFDDGDYLAAQEMILGIDRGKLDAERQALRDDYLSRIQVAITMSEKALRDLEDAETAIADGEADEAGRLLRNVLANEYAAENLRRTARTHLRGLPGGKAGGIPAAKPTRGVVPEALGEPIPAVAPLDAQRAQVLTREADDTVRAGRYDEARRLYGEALRLVPGYPEAVDGLRRAGEHERNISGSRERTLIERIRGESRINWQRTVAEYRDVERTVRDHVTRERFDEARQLLVRARQVVKSGKQFADPVTKYESLRSELEALEAFVGTEERLYNERKVSQVRREIEEQRRKHLREVEERRSRQVDALMKQAMQHRKDGEFDVAITVLKQILVIDPRHKPARWMIDMLDDLRQYRLGRELRKDFYDQSRGALHDVEESKIPWYDLLRYPKNWRELSARPGRQQRGGIGPNGRLLGALNKRIPVDFRDSPFEQVIERLADAHRLNIIVNWYDLQRAGVERDTPIDLSLPREITLKKALTEILDQAGRGIVDIGFDVAEGTIKVSTRARLDKETYTAVYDINDLLMEIPMFNDAPMTDLTKTMARANRREFTRSNQPWRSDDDEDGPNEDPGRSSRVQRIIDLVEGTVAPDSWYDRGGSIGTITEFNGQLVVTQNSSALRQIGDLLGKLREQRAIQIAVEARFITVSSHYLEELGIDIDFVLNAGNAGFDYVPAGQGALTDPVLGSPLLLPRHFSRLGFTPSTPALGTTLTPLPAAGQLAQPFGQTQFIPQRGGGGGSQATPVPIINRISSFTDPSTFGSDIPGSFAGTAVGPAFSLFGSFLDNIQVDFLIRATQADSRTTVLTAPRLVLFNGQRSWVAVTIQQGYVSQLNPVAVTGAVAQAPVTSVIDSGAVLDVTATVTADKRYVTMTLRPGVTRLLDMQTIPFTGGAAGGGFGGGPALAAFIQLPTLSSQRVSTTVSVPDGGTLLIGGQKLASEIEVEAGVPILSKIPILKRIYQSRSTVKDEQTLLILVKPKILIQTEQEELAFPSFNGG
jgi:type II secretory pathway component GspD/PulD (secretin)/tetratricopeptide (TPR) repeat protein